MAVKSVTFLFSFFEFFPFLHFLSGFTDENERLDVQGIGNYSDWVPKCLMAICVKAKYKNRVEVYVFSLM